LEANAAFVKKKRNELAFRQAQVEIEELKKRALEGEMVLAYVDEVGFAKAHPNRGLWTLKGARHLIEAVRGARLNVMGAILSTGKVFQIKYWEKTTANIFGAFIVGLRNFVKNPITIILDNASVHKAKSAKNLIRFLKTEDVNLYFLPPYSPELNRIGGFWLSMKQTWMQPKCRNNQELEEDVDEIFNNFGIKYKFSFW
jgi:transposase